MVFTPLNSLSCLRAPCTATSPSSSLVCTCGFSCPQSSHVLRRRSRSREEQPILLLFLSHHRTNVERALPTTVSSSNSALLFIGSVQNYRLIHSFIYNRDVIPHGTFPSVGNTLFSDVSSQASVTYLGPRLKVRLDFWIVPLFAVSSMTGFFFIYIFFLKGIFVVDFEVLNLSGLSSGL